MALHLSGYKDRNLLEIKTFGLLILIKGKPVHPAVEQLNLHRDSKGKWEKAELQIVSFNGPFEANIFDPFTGDATTQMRRFEPGQKVFPCFYEQQAYNIQIKALDGEDIQFYHENKNISRSFDSQ